MTTLEEGKYVADWLKWEEDRQYSREVVTLASGNLKHGTVLGKITASGKYAQFDDTATDGTEAAAGILYADADASGGDVEAVIIVGPALVVADQLIWPETADAAEKAAAMTALKALEIKEREEA